MVVHLKMKTLTQNLMMQAMYLWYIYSKNRQMQGQTQMVVNSFLIALVQSILIIKIL